MQLQPNSKSKTFRTSLSTRIGSISKTFIFSIDSLSLLLFAVVILGIVNHMPPYSDTIIHILFISITSFLMFFFAYRRIFSMALLKLGMLILLYIANVSAYFA